MKLNFSTKATYSRCFLLLLSFLSICKMHTTYSGTYHQPCNSNLHMIQISATTTVKKQLLKQLIVTLVHTAHTCSVQLLCFMFYCADPDVFSGCFPKREKITIIIRNQKCVESPAYNPPGIAVSTPSRQQQSTNVLPYSERI